MVDINGSPELAEAYTEGFQAGIRFEQAYQEPGPWSRLNPLIRKLVLLFLAVSLLGWLYAGLEAAGIAPSPVANAAASSTTAMLQPALTASHTLRPFWNGTDPKVWTSTDQPLCDAHVAHEFRHRYGWLRFPGMAHDAPLTCKRLQPAATGYPQVFAWEALP